MKQLIISIGSRAALKPFYRNFLANKTGRVQENSINRHKKLKSEIKRKIGWRIEMGTSSKGSSPGSFGRYELPIQPMTLLIS
ncbi:hypothetical protein QQ045_021257 [Rhodiola kirilowii]